MADHQRGGGGYADHRRGGFTDNRSSPYQRPRSRGSFPPNRGGRGQDMSQRPSSGGFGFGEAFHRTPTSSGFGEAFNRPAQSSSGSSSGFGQAFNRSSSSGFGEAFHRPSTSQSQDYHSNRPRYNAPARTGTQKTTLGCNFIKLQLLDSTRMVYEYEVLFEPEISDRFRKSRIANKHFYTVTKSGLKVYDQGSLMWSPIKTENEMSEGTYELGNGGEQVKVVLKRKTQRNIAECKIILNVLIKRIMTESELVKIRRSYFNPDLRSLSEEHRLEIWPGFVETVGEFDGGILLNIDVSFKVLQNGTVYTILSELMRSADAQTFKERALKCLLGLSVITRYNNNIVKIDDIDFDANPLSTFERKGQKITYLEYYKTQYNINILDMHQPMLVSRIKKRPMGNQQEEQEVLNYYVPELCHPTGLTDDQRTNFRLMKHIASITQLTPENRNRDIVKFLKCVNENVKCKKLLNDWGLKIPNESIELEGRTLAPIPLEVGNRRIVQEASADWGRALSREQVLNGVPLDDWAVIYTGRDERTANVFCRKLIETCGRVGIQAQMPKFQLKLDNDRPEEYCRHLKSLDKVKLVMVIFPTKRDDRYITVKRLCHDMNIPSQVINAKTISNPQKLDGVATKVVMQINCKLGGSPWGVSIPHGEEGVMICGLEMSHESKRSRPADSTVALVASVDKNATRWTSSTALTPAGQNVIDRIETLFEPVLQEWFQFNGKYPKYIIVYRVGTSDGQINIVRELEVGRLKQVFSRIQPNYSPSITYIVVQSKHNTRFYSKNGNRLDNPPPGTILNHTITKKNMEDFYLVSPSVRQGTVAPTHYVVVENKSDMVMDEIESITYKMTHLYFNWNATIRVPAPCQYAQRLAGQIGQRILPPTAQSMKSTLFYL